MNILPLQENYKNNPFLKYIKENKMLLTTVVMLTKINRTNILVFLLLGLLFSCAKDDVRPLTNGEKIAQELKSTIGATGPKAFAYEYKWSDFKKANDWVTMNNISASYTINGSFITLDGITSYNLNNLQRYEVKGGTLHVYFSVDK